jgi:cytidine deaminase
VAAAVPRGARRFAALAVAVASGAPILPCGACLQAFAEFGDLDLVLAWPAAGAATPRVVALHDLLTAPFALPGAP